jgi:AraC-like DNA-binding protein
MSESLPVPNTSLFLPPYESFVSPRQLEYCPNRGVAAVWFVRDGATQQAERDWLADRPSGVELVVVLPPPAAIHSALPLLKDLGELRPRGILPNGPLSGPEPVRLVLSSSPRDLSQVVVAHLARGGVLRNHRIRTLVTKMFELAPTVPSISRLARKLYTSRRTLGRIFEAEGLPVPSHWLQFARLLHVSAIIQEKREMPIFRAAIHVGYPDGFTMSNQMKRLIGCRPSDVRENLGYEWIVEEWVRREYAAGRLKRSGSAALYDDSDIGFWLRKSPKNSEAEN